MKNNKRSYLRMSGLALVLILAMTVVVSMAGASRSNAPQQAAVAALPLAINNAASCTVAVGSVDCDLYATAGSLTLPDATVVDIWGYSGTMGAPAELPGPTIIATEGDSVSITLYNELGQDTALIFPGQAMIPDMTGVPDGDSKVYSFTADNPGTFIFEAGLLPEAARQVAMGMYGTLIVRPLSGADQAYNAASTFDVEALLVLSEIDPNLNADPAGFDMRDYSPKYRLINGKAYPETAEIMTAAGNSVLLRYVNAGIQQHTMGVLGMRQELIARDANLRPYSQSELNESIGPGRTADAIVIVPAAPTAGTTHYAVLDTSLLLHNNGAAGFGGMLTFLTLIDGPPPATGPTTVAVSLAPNPTDGTVLVNLSAMIPGATSAEYFLGSQGIDGTGTPMSAGVGDEWTASLDVSLLAHGDHTFYVHGSDGIWGSFNFAILSLDKLGPVTSAISLVQNPSDGSMEVSVSATGNDSTSGNSDVIAAEFFVGTTGTDGSGVPMIVNPIAPITSLAGTIDAVTMAGLAEGSHTVSVHSMDSFGQWGDFETAMLIIDRTGPDTSNVVADPNPNNGSTPYSPTVFAVRVDATLADTSSSLQRAEGFINTEGLDGSGFPLSPNDGQFNELTEDAYVFIPLSTISALGVGTQRIYIHAQDASGNWGPTNYVDFVIETDIPTVSNIFVSPNPTESAVSVLLEADAIDATSNIVMAEWYEGADPGAGNGKPMSAADGAFDSAFESLEVTIEVSGWADGDYSLFVRAKDAAGSWSDSISVVLTVTGSTPPVVPDLLYFSTAGSGTVPGVPGPNDDADVYLWDGTVFSREFDGTAEGGLAGNTDIDAMAFDGGLFYLSFNRNGGTNVPGVGVVQDEDVVTYNPGDLQWELFFAGVDVCDGMDASNGHDIDAFALDLVGGLSYFSTEGNAEILGLAGPFDDADIYSIGPGGCTRVFDASVEGLPGEANIDGLTVVDGDTFYMSFTQDGLSVPGIGGLVQDEDVVLYDAGVWSLYLDNSLSGLGGSNSQDLDGFDIE